MTVNTATLLNHIKQFFKGFKIIFPYYTKRAFCIQTALKEADIQFKFNNVLRNEDEEY